MTREEIFKEINVLSKRISSVERRLSDFTDIRVGDITPYTDTKTAYIGDTELVFYDTPEGGNVTVFFEHPYTMERIADKITLTFEPLEDITDITISIV